MTREPSQPMPLILVPGLLCSAALWRPQIEALSGIADIAVADHARDRSMAAIADRLLAHAPARFALAGLSLGGYVALAVVRQAPERVERLALLATSARADSPAERQRRRDFLALAARGKFRGVTERLLPSLIHPSRLSDQALVQTIFQMADEIGEAGFVNQQTAIMSRDDSRPDLPAIRCPTLVLCGREDAIRPLALHEEMAAAIPGARLCVLDETGHLPTLERPAAVNAALAEWLRA